MTAIINTMFFAEEFFGATLSNPSKISRNILTNTEKEAGRQFFRSIHRKIERLSLEVQDITKNTSEQRSIDDPIEEIRSTQANSTEDVLTLQQDGNI